MNTESKAIIAEFLLAEREGRKLRARPLPGSDGKWVAMRGGTVVLLTRHSQGEYNQDTPQGGDSAAGDS